MKGQMNERGEIWLKNYTRERKGRYLQNVPITVASVVGAGVGAVLQSMGMVSGGEILANYIYTDRLNRPIQELVNLYFNDFSRHIKDIQRMDKILGENAEYDLPEGEKEKERIPVTELPNFDISIKNLRCKNILRGLNLNVKQGEFLTIAGESWAGKSTLLRNLVGLYPPDGGEITIGEVPNNKIKKYGKESIYSVMSYCNHSPQIFEGMTLRQNLLLWSKEPVADKRIAEVLKDLHLESFAGRLDEEVKHLSGGERVRIGVARTLIKGAKIMLLDEPTASLDSQAASEVRRVIGEIKEKYPDTTIICVSHDDELIKSSKRSVNIKDLQS